MRIIFILFFLYVSASSFAGKGNSEREKNIKLNYTIGIKIRTIGRGETFVFSLGAGNQIAINSNLPVNFPGSFPPGYNYKIKQVSGPRTCHFFPGDAGTISNSNTIIECDGGVPDGHALLNGIFKAPKGTTIELLNNGTDKIRLVANAGPTLFNFPKAYLSGSACNIAVSTKPAEMKVIVSWTSGEPNTFLPGSFLNVTADYSYELVSLGTKDSVLGTFYESWDPCIDKALFDAGRYVVFVSQAKGLGGSSGKYRQIFWRDRVSGETRMISRASNGEEGNGNSFAPVISVGSMYVAFESYATNLVDNDRNGVRDVFLWQRTAEGGIIERVSVGPGGVEGNGESFEPSVSGMGNEVVFSSNASNLAEDGAETSGVNVYLRERNSKTTTLISRDYKTGKGVGGSKPSIDMNGYKIAFCSYAGTLVPNDNNNLWDIFLFERNTSKVALPLRRITMAYDGGERNQGTESSSRVITPTISGNGRFISYATTASNVVPGDNNNAQDAFVFDAANNTTIRISVDNNGIEGNGDSPIGQGERIALSENGNIAAFTTMASNFGTPANNVVEYNLSEKKMIPVSAITGTYVSTPSISRNGHYVAFGCGQPLDIRFKSSGLFVAFTGISD